MFVFAFALCAVVASAHVVEKKDFPDKPVEEWTHDELKMWLEKAHLGFFKMMMEDKVEAAVEKWFMPEAKFIKMDGTLVIGKDALIPYFQHSFNTTTHGWMPEHLAKTTMTWHSTDLWTSEETMVDHSCVTVTCPEMEQDFNFRTVTIWKMYEGKWKIALDTCFSKSHEM